MALPSETQPLPLTTVWSAPAGCPTIIPSTTKEGCQPSGWSENLAKDGLYYSPGICISGYTIGCTARGPTANGAPIASGETAGLCVPSSWKCSMQIRSETEQWVYEAETILETPSITGTTTVTQLLAPAFQILWKSPDLSILETPPIPTKTKTSSGTESPTPPTVSLPCEPGSKDLSTGAIVGIVFGVVIFVLIVTVIGTLRDRRKRRAARSKSTVEDPSGAPELDGSNPIVPYVHEKDSTPVPAVHEMSSGQDPTAETRDRTDKMVHGDPGIPELMSQSIPSQAISHPSELYVADDTTTAPGTVNVPAQGSQTFPYSWNARGVVDAHGPAKFVTAQIDPGSSMYYQEASVPVPAVSQWETTSSTDAVGNRSSSPGPSNPAEIAELLEKQARIQERRRRLLELERLDKEEEELQRRIRESQR